MPELSYCGEQLRRFDRERYLTALFAPPGRREALFALYAFNLEVAKTRETVSQPLIGRIRLEWWREAVDELYGGRTRAHPVIEALAPVAPLLSRPLVERLIDAREHDLADTPFADLAALEAYAEASSGTLLELAGELLGATDEPSRAAARHVGTAWAMLGLIRLVPHQGSAGAALLPGGADDRAALRPVVRQMAERAAQRIAAARALRPSVSPVALPPLLLARLVDPMLARLRRAGYDAWALPERVPLAALRIAFGAWRDRY